MSSRRARFLNAQPIRPGRYVLYWMQQAQRAHANPALEHAIAKANEAGLPVLVGFGLTGDYPDANRRHYAFMLEGLAETAHDLGRRGIGFTLRHGAPDTVAIELSREAALVVCDRGYLRHQRSWRSTLAEAAPCTVIEVEGELVVPVETASPKHEYAARTLRPKLHRQMEPFLEQPPDQRVVHRAERLVAHEGLAPDAVPGWLTRLGLDDSVPPVRRLRPGNKAARQHLDDFVADKLARYADGRGKPEAHAVSYLSPYLHFGQISPVEIIRAVKDSGLASGDSGGSFLDELVVRRELAANHVFYEPHYDRYESLPEWARKTLDAHRRDPRPHLYAPAAFEAGETHDAVWNAAMLEMRATGYMHNRLRMYWGKKILEWSRDPEEAFTTLLTLNNRYLLDGRDPNSYANVGWIFGLHDRPWFGRPVFGTVRPMGEASLKKFDSAGYIDAVAEMAAAEGYAVR
jgi:deoxyribodipyrimidine photo-lyase